MLTINGSDNDGLAHLTATFRKGGWDDVADVINDATQAVTLVGPPERTHQLKRVADPTYDGGCELECGCGSQPSGSQPFQAPPPPELPLSVGFEVNFNSQELRAACLHHAREVVYDFWNTPASSTVVAWRQRFMAAHLNRVLQRQWYNGIMRRRFESRTPTRPDATVMWVRVATLFMESIATARVERDNATGQRHVTDYRIERHENWSLSSTYPLHATVVANYAPRTDEPYDLLATSVAPPVYARAEDWWGQRYFYLGDFVFNGFYVLLANSLADVEAKWPHVVTPRFYALNRSPFSAHDEDDDDDASGRFVWTPKRFLQRYDDEVAFVARNICERAGGHTFDQTTERCTRYGCPATLAEERDYNCRVTGRHCIACDTEPGRETCTNGCDVTIVHAHLCTVTGHVIRDGTCVRIGCKATEHDQRRRECGYGYIHRRPPFAVNVRRAHNVMITLTADQVDWLQNLNVESSTAASSSSDVASSRPIVRRTTFCKYKEVCGYCYGGGDRDEGGKPAVPVTDDAASTPPLSPDAIMLEETRVDGHGVVRLEVEADGRHHTPSGFYGYKSAIDANGDVVIGKLFFAGSARLSADGLMEGKIRADWCVVVAAARVVRQRAHCVRFTERVDRFRSFHDTTFAYPVGGVVRAATFDPNPRQRCSGGIHFFLNVRDALNIYLMKSDNVRTLADIEGLDVLDDPSLDDAVVREALASVGPDGRRCQLRQSTVVATTDACPLLTLCDDLLIAIITRPSLLARDLRRLSQTCTQLRRLVRNGYVASRAGNKCRPFRLRTLTLPDDAARVLAGLTAAGDLVYQRTDGTVARLASSGAVATVTIAGDDALVKDAHSSAALERRRWNGGTVDLPRRILAAPSRIDGVACDTALVMALDVTADGGTLEVSVVVDAAQPPAVVSRVQVPASVSSDVRAVLGHAYICASGDTVFINDRNVLHRITLSQRVWETVTWRDVFATDGQYAVSRDAKTRGRWLVWSVDDLTTSVAAVQGPSSSRSGNAVYWRGQLVLMTDDRNDGSLATVWQIG
jgi:hypothetical protein